MKLVAFGASCLILVAVGVPAQAKGGFFPTYHPQPCEGDSCRADDPRSGESCTGLLCTFSSAKAMQPPVTASQAAAMQARAAAAPAAVPAPAAEPAKKKRKVAAKHPKASKPPAEVAAKVDLDPAK